MFGPSHSLEPRNNLPLSGLRARGVTHKSAFCKRGSVNVRFAPKATGLVLYSKLTRRANSDLTRCSKSRPLFDHLVGAQKQRGRDHEADRRGSFEVEHKFKGRWLFNGKIGGRGATQHFDEQPCHLSVHQSETRTVSDEAAIFHDLR